MRSRSSSEDSYDESNTTSTSSVKMTNSDESTSEADDSETDSGDTHFHEEAHTNILSKTVQSNEKLIQAINTSKANKKYFLPKQVMYSYNRSKIIKQLSLPATKGATQHYIPLDNIVVKYMPHLLGKQESFFFARKNYTYSYPETYVSLGIPVKRYDWFVKEAQRLVGNTIKRNSLFESDEYVWIIAEIDQDRSTECYTYSGESGDIISIGYLPELLQLLKSDALGIGHFNVSVCQSRDLNIFYPKFTLRYFQFVDKAQGSKMIIPFTKVEPPTELMEKLLLK